MSEKYGEDQPWHLTQEPEVILSYEELKDRIEELEAERDDYAFRLAEANNTYSEMHVALSEVNDKLAKAVEIALEECPYRWGTDSWMEWRSERRATLAKLKGDKT